MKITLFEQAPYRYLPDDFEQHHQSVCNTPYSVTTRDGVYSSVRDFMDELISGARAGFDGIAITEHGQSSYDMMPNPDLVASALAYQTEAEGLDVAIFPMGRSLGKAREPVRVAEEYAFIDVLSGGRLVAGFPIGLHYDASVNNGVPPIEIRPRFDENLELLLRAWREPEPFVHNGRFSQYPMVNIWPRPLQPSPPVWITGIGNPRTMQMCLERNFGFNYLSWFGAKLTGKRIFDRFWEIADQVGVPRNPYRLGFLQTIAVAETDERAEQEYAAHLEYGFRKGLGSIPPEMLGLPGGIDIRGVQALVKDPGDFGLYYEMKTASFRDLVDAGVVICGSPATVREQLREFCTQYGIGTLHAMLGFGSLPRDLAMKNIQLFAEEVAPFLRDLWTDTENRHHWWPERLGGDPTPVTPGASATEGAPTPTPTPDNPEADGGDGLMTTTETSGPVITQEAVPVWNGKLSIKVKIAGAGAPLLYLHPAAGLAWDPFLSHLAQTHTVYAPEFPGTSAGDPYAIHGVDHLSDVVLIYEEVVRTLGLHKPVLVGQSFGGMIAAELAAAFPQLASKVVLLDPVGLWRDDLPVANWIATPPAELPALLFHDPGSPAAQSMLAMPEDPDIAAAAVAALVWAFGSTGKFAWPVPDRGLRARLHRLTAPVLLIWGNQDRLAPVGYVGEWQNELADSQAVLIDNCGHIPQVEQLDQTVAAVEKFLS